MNTLAQPPALTDAEVVPLRALTPGCAQVSHFNHAGASLPSQASLDAIQGQLLLEASGPMEATAEGARLQEQARQVAGQLLNSPTSSVAFTTSGSAAWGMAFAALGPWQPGQRILVGRHEWGGNLACMALAQAQGASVEVIPCEPDGSVSVEALEHMLDERVRLIALTWLPANGGLINPAERIGALARRHGIAYFIDGGQAFGQLPVDVQALGCDVFKAAGRKFLRAPRGTAVMYARQEFLNSLRPAFVDVLSAPWSPGGYDVRDDARRFETSEVSLALLAGLGAALDQARQLGIPRIRTRIQGLANNLRERLTDIPGLVLHDLGTADNRSGLIAFNLAGLDPFAVKEALGRQRIHIGANGVPYTPLDMSARQLAAVARISVSYLTVESEIDRLVEALAQLARAS